ncbi:uncharacterized protein LOC127714405 [Mytilus californianus]|uniref:uncharacterized protein LOC127714405 n=1 Tax=Mytilus californianus TaxID=6549 RepID=UPI002247EEF6|nr:uncharacterized protein LOC127714405 [Mytilus californianus]
MVLFVLFVASLLIVTQHVYSSAPCCMPDKFESHEYLEASIINLVKSTYLQTANVNISFDFTSKKTVAVIYNIKADGKSFPSMSILVDYEAGVAYIVQNNKCTKSAAPRKMQRACVPEIFKIAETTHFGAGSEMLPVHKYQYSYGNTTSRFTVTAKNCYYISYEAHDSQRPEERPRGEVFGITLGIKDPSVFSVPALCKKTADPQDVPEYQAGKFHPFV